MESHMLDKLTEKYWKGEATEAELLQLKEGLKTSKLSPDQLALKEYLAFLDHSKEQNVLGKDFDELLIQKVSESKRRELFPLNWRNMAAAFLLLCGLGYGINWSLNQTTEILPVQAKVERKSLEGNFAFNEVRDALLLLSENLNQGLEHSRLLGEFHKTTEVLELTKDQK
ncbi:MAG: hypothetical protein AAF696_34225, partial [Bacteroidota bacterium]